MKLTQKLNIIWEIIDLILDDTNKLPVKRSFGFLKSENFEKKETFKNSLLRLRLKISHDNASEIEQELLNLVNTYRDALIESKSNRYLKNISARLDIKPYEEKLKNCFSLSDMQVAIEKNSKYSHRF